MSNNKVSTNADISAALARLNDPAVQDRALAASRVALLAQLKTDEVVLTPELIVELVKRTNGSTKSAEDVLAGAAAVVIGFGLSDCLLKENIKRVGVAESGVGIYEFNYSGMNDRWQGAVAQDVLLFRPDAVIKDASGFLKVDYDVLKVTMHRIN